MDPDPSVSGLRVAFARIQGMLLSQANATTAVDQLARVARAVIGPAVGAGASLFDDTGRAGSTGATDVLTAAADALQYELGEGPCLSAWATAAVVRIDDTAPESRWPDWYAAAHAQDIRSVLSTPLVLGGRRVGAMKVYAGDPGAFTVEDEGTLGLLAAAVAVLLGCAQPADAPHRLSASLQAALADRQEVGVAVGVLMERHGTDVQEARAALLDEAVLQERPLAQVVRQILARLAGREG
ncbi:transcriptional regulator [Kocuria dechangensis]|uniref:Transcriptional regulator n=1 Tax=Kocuria dechangensis TaxID=1176249 RepID=A0A917LZ60_9MICC|nr:GAF and ANTAR domain-containing protein [Kocuria dechangensis]GGG67409.1 transcriptional regulator [Kocuria dechangensis]